MGTKRQDKTWMIILTLTLFFISCREEQIGQVKESGINNKLHKIALSRPINIVNPIPNIINEVQIINKLLLKKKMYIRFSPINKDYKNYKWQAYSKEEKKYHEYVQKNDKEPLHYETCSIYTDTNNRIREVIWGLNLKGSYSFQIEYFTARGDLSYVVFREEIYKKKNKESYSGHIYFANKRIYKAESIYYSRRYKRSKPKSVYNILPLDFNSWLSEEVNPQIKGYRPPFAYHKDIKQVKTHIPHFKKASQGNFYTFSKPKLEEHTYINKQNTVLYEYPSKQNKIVGKLNALDEVEIISVGSSESLETWHKHNWYEIKTAQGQTGWVFGAFLEPIEVNIE